jgi:hypothetical protein
MQDTITIDGQVYVKSQPNGKRAIIVVDRGWIFAGDVEERDGRIYLSRAVHVQSWESVGFSGLVEDPKVAKAKIKACANVDIPKDSEIFRVPVGDLWGL